MLVTGQLDKLADEGHVVVVSSAYHTLAPREGIRFDNLIGEQGYNGWVACGQSKLANILFAKELQRRFSSRHPAARAVVGQYFADCNVARPNRKTEDPDLAGRLWDASERIVQELMPRPTTGNRS
ncbi:MAG: hypothetical protein HGB04_04970 [Chlorobiaceae bacterium]|nr:hypothetical protein [Chlorobiaceae bacterium]